MRTPRIDAHQHLLALRGRRNTAGSTTRWRRCGATFCRRTRSRKCARQALTTRRGAGATEPRGDRLAARARRPPPLHRRRRRLGRPAIGRPGCTARGLAGQPRLVGVRHVVQAEPDDFLARPEVRRGIARVEHFGLAYDILVYARQLPRAIEFAAAFPAARLVLDHLGKPDIRAGAFDCWRADLDRLARQPNVFAKLSGLVTEADWRGWTAASLRPYVDAALDAFGADRLMIGSDWPVCTVAGYLRGCHACRDRCARGENGGGT